MNNVCSNTKDGAGTVIITGTLSGVELFRKPILKDGDVVEVEIEGVMKGEQYYEI